MLNRWQKHLSLKQNSSNLPKKEVKDYEKSPEKNIIELRLQSMSMKKVKKKSILPKEIGVIKKMKAF